MSPIPESRKRPASMINDGEHSLKRQKRHYHHSHSIHIKQDSAVDHILNDPLSIFHQLRRSIALTLRIAGFTDATSEALDSFTSAAEEYMDHILHHVHTAMEAGKRTQAIPFDFEYALNTHQLTLRSLLPHLKPPIPKTESRARLVAPRIEAQELVINKDQVMLEQFSLGMQDSKAQAKLAYAPRKLPSLPSEHTYKATPALPTHASDAKTIRERATEESRLGEEALRRLVSAGQQKGKGLMSDHDYDMTNSAYQRCWDMLVEEGAKDQSHIDLMRTDFSGPPVNAESRYWRKSVRPTKLVSRIKNPG